MRRISITNQLDFLYSIMTTYGHLPGFAALTSDPLSEGPHYIFLEPFGEAIESAAEIHAALHQIRISPEHKHIPNVAGFFSYEFLHHLEAVPRPTKDNYHLPDCLLHRYRSVLKISNAVCEIYAFNGSAPHWRIKSDNIIETLLTAPIYVDAAFPEDVDRITHHLCIHHSTMSRDVFLSRVREIREAILDGSVYQVNLSHQITLPTELNPAELFFKLLAHEHAAHGAYLKLQNESAILSLSPELFFRREADSVSVRPIKGTSPRLSDTKLDAQSKNELFHSEKNRAELAMIVDLMRNDLSRIAVSGSVTVESFPEIFSLTMVHHLYAKITARIRPEVDDLDIISALFPSGSVTGTPKIAAMQYISSLEQTTRGVYCGSIGFFGHSSSQWNVAIRTGVYTSGSLRFQVGGGITIDSVPEEEYVETLSKARAFVKALMPPCADPSLE